MLHRARHSGDHERVDEEQIFLEYYKKLDEETKKLAKIREIVEAAEEDGDFKTALENVQKFVARRLEALDRVTIHMAEGFRPSPRAFSKILLILDWRSATRLGLLETAHRLMCFGCAAFMVVIVVLKSFIMPKCTPKVMISIGSAE